MTYSLFLLIFLILPIIALSTALAKRVFRSQMVVLTLICLLAFIYTTPWDNYAAYKKMWRFAPAFVWGKPLWFGYLPLEEYLFYFAEAILVCLMLVALSQVKALKPDWSDLD